MIDPETPIYIIAGPAKGKILRNPELWQTFEMDGADYATTCVRLDGEDTFFAVPVENRVMFTDLITVQSLLECFHVQESASRYFFAQDDDGHWYQVPSAYRPEWRAWCAGEIESHEAPPFAERIDSPEFLDFENPQEMP